MKRKRESKTSSIEKGTSSKRRRFPSDDSGNEPTSGWMAAAMFKGLIV